MYVDDVIIVLRTEDEAIGIRKTICKMFSLIEMKLRKSSSNSPKLLQTIPNEDEAPFMEDKDEESEKIQLKSKPTKIC